MRRPDRNVGLNIAIGMILALLLVLTLAPSSANTIDFRSLCLICGERGLADAILNVKFNPQTVAGLMCRSCRSP